MPIVVVLVESPILKWYCRRLFTLGYLLFGCKIIVERLAAEHKAITLSFTGEL